MDWIPDSCTLPTAERPLRAADFDRVFAEDLNSVTRDNPDVLMMRFRARAGLREELTELTRRESSCCSFFRFELAEAPDGVVLRVSVPSGRSEVLDDLQRRASLVASNHD